jgi:hypothetical protein
MPSSNISITLLNVLLLLVIITFTIPLITSANEEVDTLAESLASAVMDRLQAKVQGACQVTDGHGHVGYPLGHTCWPGEVPPGYCPCLEGLICDWDTTVCVEDPGKSDSSAGEFGDSCTVSPDSCGEGLSCHHGKNPTCQHLPRLTGELCGHGEPCAIGLKCSKQKKCVPNGRRL